MSTSGKGRVPAYRAHKATGQARVTIEGHDYYLGAFGSPESKARYSRLIAEYVRDGTITGKRGGGTDAPYFIANLCEDFLLWAQREYRTVAPGERAAPHSDGRCA